MLRLSETFHNHEPANHLKSTDQTRYTQGCKISFNITKEKVFCELKVMEIPKRN